MADPLEALRPIHLPAPPASSLVEMLAAGAAGGVLAALLLSGALALWSRRRARHAPRRAALLALRTAAGLPPDERAFAHARLLRLYATAIDGPDALRAQGAAWLARLDGLFETDFFTRGDGALYGEALYRPLTETDLAPREDILRDFLHRHRPAR